MRTDDTAVSVCIFGEAREDLLNVPTDEVSMDLIVCADPDWHVDGNTDRLNQMFATLNIEPQMRTVVLGCAMQRELPNGGILGSSNIVYSPERLAPKLTGLRLMYVDGTQGLKRMLGRLRVPHAWVIGDADTFRQLAPYCSRAYVIADGRCGSSGSSVPPLESAPGWQFEKTFEAIRGSRRRLSVSKYINCRCRRLEGAAPQI